jgi:hypothetical protein
MQPTMSLSTGKAAYRTDKLIPQQSTHSEQPRKSDVHQINFGLVEI